MQNHVCEEDVDLHCNLIITITQYLIRCNLTQNTNTKNNLYRNQKQPFIKVVRLLFRNQMVFFLITHPLRLKNCGTEINMKVF